MIHLNRELLRTKQSTRNPRLRARLRCGLVGVLLFAFALGISVTACDSALDETQQRKAPTFTLPSMQGEQITLESVRGKIVILDFWATWCNPCREQIPILNRVYERNHDAGVVVYGISMDADGAKSVEPFMKKMAMRYPVLLGRNEVAEAYGVRSFPTSIVIDAEGYVRFMHLGVADERMIEKLVARARVPRKEPTSADVKAKG